MHFGEPEPILGQNDQGCRDRRRLVARQQLREGRPALVSESGGRPGSDTEIGMLETGPQQCGE